MTLEKWRNLDAGLLIIRLALAAVFIAHGWSKLQNLEGTVGFFESLGLAAFFAYLVSAIELVGGIAMLLGIFTDWAGLLLAIVMLGAIYFPPSKSGFALSQFAMEFQLQLVLFASALGIFFGGPGKHTVKKWLGKSEV